MLRRLEDRLLSDTHRVPRALFLWAIFVTLLCAYAHQGSALRQPTILSYLRDPSGHDGQRLSFAFGHPRLAPAAMGARLEIDSTAGWLPLDAPPGAVPPGETVSVGGVFRAPGRLTVDEVIVHPDRGGKVRVSLLTLIGLTVAVLARALAPMLRRFAG